MSDIISHINIIIDEHEHVNNIIIGKQKRISYNISGSKTSRKTAKSKISNKIATITKNNKLSHLKSAKNILKKSLETLVIPQIKIICDKINMSKTGIKSKIISNIINNKSHYHNYNLYAKQIYEHVRLLKIQESEYIKNMQNVAISTIQKYTNNN